jgi:predicted GIY-YIG superfamily endonuclease
MLVKESDRHMNAGMGQRINWQLNRHQEATFPEYRKVSRPPTVHALPTPSDEVTAITVEMTPARRARSQSEEMFVVPICFTVKGRPLVAHRDASAYASLVNAAFVDSIKKCPEFAINR